MFNRILGDKIFPIPSELPNEDKWTALHMMYFTDIIHIPFISLLYRIHSKNSSSRTKSFNIKNIEMHERFIVYSLFLSFLAFFESFQESQSHTKTKCCCID